MNRKEHIDKAALEYAQTRSENKGIAYLTFKDVAEWAELLYENEINGEFNQNEEDSYGLIEIIDWD